MTWFQEGAGVDLTVLGDLMRLERMIHENRLLFLKVALFYEFERTKVVNMLASTLELSEKTVRSLFRYPNWASVEEEMDRCVQICKKLSGIRFGRCITSSELHFKTKALLVATLENSLNTPVELEFEHSDIIGGVILELGDYRFDASYLRILDELEKRFLKNMLLGDTHE